MSHSDFKWDKFLVTHYTWNYRLITANLVNWIRYYIRFWYYTLVWRAFNVDIINLGIQLNKLIRYNLSKVGRFISKICHWFVTKFLHNDPVLFNTVIMGVETLVYGYDANIEDTIVRFKASGRNFCANLTQNRSKITRQNCSIYNAPSHIPLLVWDFLVKKYY